jgi:hypothetical protein
MDGKVAYVDFGDIEEKVGAVENAERAMGLRALHPERLDYIEKALNQAAKERE